MREVNFSIPSANKASVGITTALYDRRALDCTSTLPIINSLNNLAYLTTSSARIREILTVDSGLERLVCILKNGRSKDMMESWKWNLAFQCVFNIGVRGSDGRSSDSRGSENIRTRVVEADMVPVIATILDNYMRVLERAKAVNENSDIKRPCSKFGPCKRPFSRTEDRNAPTHGLRVDRRRQTPSTLFDIPSAIGASPSEMTVDSPPAAITPSGPFPATLNPFLSPLHQVTLPPLATQFSRQNNTTPSSGEVRRDEEHQPSRTSRLPSMNVPSGQYEAANSERAPPGLAHTLLAPRPGTPMTPIAADLEQARNRAEMGALNVPGGRVVSANQLVVPDMSNVDRNGFVLVDQDMLTNSVAVESRVASIEDRMDMVDIAEMEAERADLLGTANNDESIEVQNMGSTDAETFNITHRTRDGSIEGSATPTPRNLGRSPVQAAFNTGEPSGEVPQTMFPRMMSPDILALGPRDEDVILSLQLLAYVSKYCHLRPYFQRSHLVPKLRISAELSAWGSPPLNDANMCEEIDNDNEYLQADDYNIFPLVEKFTVRQHSAEMKYWAEVVMRNLCRKDKSRGDIRQCAYYKCGKWEEYARQFAKCRRCRQTKYCSKECQKSAWPFHRYWCQAASA